MVWPNCEERCFQFGLRLEQCGPRKGNKNVLGHWSSERAAAGNFSCRRAKPGKGAEVYVRPVCSPAALGAPQLKKLAPKKRTQLQWKKRSKTLQAKEVSTILLYPQASQPPSQPHPTSPQPTQPPNLHAFCLIGVHGQDVPRHRLLRLQRLKGRKPAKPTKLGGPLSDPLPKVESDPLVVGQIGKFGHTATRPTKQPKSEGTGSAGNH